MALVGTLPYLISIDLNIVVDNDDNILSSNTFIYIKKIASNGYKNNNLLMNINLNPFTLWNHIFNDIV